MRASRGIASLTLALALSGCGLFRAKEVPVEDPVDAALARSAERIEKTWSTVHGMQSRTGGLSRPVPPATFPSDAVPPELAVRVDMEWWGELEPAVRALAETVGFRFRTVGARHPSPILVSLTGKGDSVGQLLREAGQQAGARADVIVRMDGREVEVLYRDARH